MVAILYLQHFVWTNTESRELWKLKELKCQKHLVMKMCEIDELVKQVDEDIKTLTFPVFESHKGRGLRMALARSNLMTCFTMRLIYA